MLARSIAIYGVSEAVNRGIPFLLLPILSYFLSPTEVGLLFLYYTATDILIYFSGLNLNATIRPLAVKQQAEAFSRYVRSGLLAVALAATVLALFGFPVTYYLWPDLPLWIGAVAAFSSGMQAVFLTSLSLNQIRKRPWVYLLLSLGYAFLNLALTLAFVVWIDRSWLGRVEGLFLSNVLAGLLGAVILLKMTDQRVRPSIHDALEAVRNGLHLVPHSISWWMRAGLDRVFLVSFISAAALGIYATAVQYATIVVVAGSVLNQALLPHVFECLRDSSAEARKRMAILGAVYMAGILCVAAVLLLGRDIFFGIIMPPAYEAAKPYALPLIGISLMHAASLFLMNVPYFYERYRWLSAISLLSAAIHVGCAYLLIGKFGAWGAIMAGGLSFAVLLSFVVYTVARLTPALNQQETVNDL